MLSNTGIRTCCSCFSAQDANGPIGNGITSNSHHARALCQAYTLLRLISADAVITLFRLNLLVDSVEFLLTAAKEGRLEIVRMLVGLGADVNAVKLWFSSDGHSTALKGAVDAKHIAVADYLRSVGAFEKCFHNAARDGDVALVQAWLLAHPKCVDDSGW